MQDQLQNMMRQAKQMQERIEKAKMTLQELQVEGKSGAGLVTVLMTGGHEVLRVQIDPSLLQEDQNMLEDLVAAAFNDATHKVEQQSQEVLSKAGAGIPMPPGFSF